MSEVIWFYLSKSTV